MKCWGNNELGTLGDGSEVNSADPVDVRGLASGVVAISAGTVMTCAVTSAGGVKCWGDDQTNELGDDSTTHSNVPVDVLGLEGVRSVSCGDSTTCAVTLTGGIKCWGVDFTAVQGCPVRLGSRSCPIATDVPGLTSGVVAVSVGESNACVLMAAGDVRCWGVFGEFGTQSLILAPASVPGLSSGVVEVSAGSRYACVLTSRGTVSCWGDNEYGQLGDGSTTNHASPVEVIGI